MDHKEIFSQRVRALRKQRRLSQQELGQIIGVTHKTISTIESGLNSTSIDKLTTLAEFFNVSADYLLGLRDDPQCSAENRKSSTKEKDLLKLLEEVKTGSVAPEDAARLLGQTAYEDLGYAKVDHHRSVRQGAAEVIFGQGKTAEQIEGIVRSMMDRGASNIIITRLSEEKEALLRGQIPYNYSPAARLAVANPVEQPLTGGVAVVSAGTSDLAVCEEAALTAEALGSRVHRVYDAGVAGLHRLLGSLETLEKARCIVAVAGMEGALPSVVGGLVSCPVIAVPTSVGYGANLGGLAALLAMLNSCASGVSVVNIDNGFGAGFLAHRINQMKGIDQ